MLYFVFFMACSPESTEGQLVTLYYYFYYYYVFGLLPRVIHQL